MKRTFAGIEPEYADFETAGIVLQPIPFDATSTWGKGADKGVKAILDAAEHMELYDIETSSEVYLRGIALQPPLNERRSPESMVKEVHTAATSLLNTGKFPTFLGGEHSVSIGLVRAFNEHFEKLSVLHIDAHADLRPVYEGSPYNHACAMHEASQNCNLIQVGVRSMDVTEVPYVQPGNCFYMHEIRNRDNQWMRDSVDRLTQHVYVSFDLDALDPAIMPATGTPEPGGFFWHEILAFLKMVFTQKDVVGFDIVELAPIDGMHAPQFLAAKLYYKMLSYKFSP